MNKNLLVGIGVVLALVLGFIGATKKSTNVLQTITNPTLGAISSPDLPTDISQGGMRSRAVHVPIFTGGVATTTLCAIQAPVATSTLLHGSVTITTGTTTALQLEIAKANDAFSTTTILNSAVFAAGRNGTVLATTTVGNGSDPSIVFAPNQYLVVRYGGTRGDTQYLQGSCNASWIQTSGY